MFRMMFASGEVHFLGAGLAMRDLQRPNLSVETNLPYLLHLSTLNMRLPNPRQAGIIDITVNDATRHFLALCIAVALSSCFP